MVRKFPNLSSPITIGRVTFRNRMFSAPMGGTDITNDGCIGPKSTAFYELRGKGGAGAVTVSECMVHPETDGSHAYHLDTSILNAGGGDLYGGCHSQTRSHPQSGTVSFRYVRRYLYDR